MGGEVRHKHPPILVRERRRDPRWLCTPLHKATARLKANLERGDRGSPLAVLVSTGAFCPVHTGHLAKMAEARAALEARGVTVLAGYLSPGHDAYLQTKCGGGVPGTAHRIALCEQAVESFTAQLDAVIADRWPGCSPQVVAISLAANDGGWEEQVPEGIPPEMAQLEPEPEPET